MALKQWFKQENQLLVLVMSIASILRFYDYAGWSLSNDELSALSRLQFDSFGEMIRLGARIDGHPVGVQAFLWFLTRIFGDSVWVVRLPFVICGILSVYFTWLIGKRWFGVATGLLAASALAFLDYPILYSQLARPYSSGLLFSIITVWFWTKIVFDEKKKLSDYAGFALFTALTAYMHHIALLFVVVVGLSGFLFYKKIEIKKYLLAGFGAFVLYLPHVEIFFHQLSLGGVGGTTGWLGRPGEGWILDYLKYASNNSWLTFSLSLVCFVVPFFLWKIKPTKFHILALVWFLLVFLTTYFYSVFRNPVLQYSVLLFPFPLLLVFLFSNINNLDEKAVLWIVPVFLLAGTFQTVFINKFSQQQHFGEFKGVAEHIAKWNRELGKENVTNTTVVNAPYYIHFYLDKLTPGIEFAQYNNQGGKDMLELVNVVKNANTGYFAFGWTKPCPPEIEEVIKYRFQFVVENQNYGGLSAVTLFSNTKPQNYIPESEPVFSLTNDMEKPGDWNTSPAAFDSLMVFSGKYSFRVDSVNEYSPGFARKISELNQGNFRNIKIQVMVFCSDTLTDFPMIISVGNAEKGLYIYASSQVGNFVNPGKWAPAFLVFEMPEILSPEDELRIYIWNPQKQTVYLDDLTIEFYNREIR